MRFAFIDAERPNLNVPLSRICTLLRVSVSGYYAWRERPAGQRQLYDMVLLAHIQASFKRSRETYGAIGVHHDLREEGVEVGQHRVERLMRDNGVSPKRKQKFKKTTDSNHDKDIAPNLLNQDFAATAPNQKWSTDISYIWTTEGGFISLLLWICFQGGLSGGKLLPEYQPIYP